MTRHTSAALLMVLLTVFLIASASAQSPEQVANSPAPPEAAVPASAQSPETPAPEDAAVLREELETLRGRVEEVDQRISRLTEAIDLFMQTVVAGYREENDALRTELRRLNTALFNRMRNPDGHVPRPNQDLFQELYRTLEQEQGGEALETPVPDEAGAPQTFQQAVADMTPEGEIEPTVVKQWQRDTDQARRMGDHVTTLVGLIAWVPRGSTDEQLLDLGRRLRKQYDSFDNINIEVFDRENAAREFAATNVATPQHRVLNVSRHAESGRDVILIIRGEEITAHEWRG